MLTCDQCGTRMPQLPVRIEIVRESGPIGLPTSPAHGETVNFTKPYRFCSADHLLPFALKTGKLEIRSNAVVARILTGANGLATGVHLHYGMKKNGRYVNPIIEHRNMPPGEPVAAGFMNVFLTERDRYLQLLFNPSQSRSANNN